ncbi:hypothetical protein BH23ACT10_BH23ACT10_39720 [soil metagenome]
MQRSVSAIACLLVLSACATSPAVEVSGAAPSSATTSAATTSVATAAAPAAAGRSELASGPESAATVAADGSADAATEVVESPDFPGGDGIAYLTRAEIGRHQSFDRVVWEFDGPVPSYRVGYVDGPVAEAGSGDPIELDGGAVIQVIFSLASGVDLSGSDPVQIYEGPQRIAGSSAGATTVTEIAQTGDFEATLSWAVGLSAVAPFTVTALTDPSRVVIDITVR